MNPAAAAAEKRKNTTPVHGGTPLDQAIHNFLKLGLPTIHDPSTWLDFEPLAQLISQHDVVASTADILNHILTTKPKKPLVRARVFLSAYILCTCDNAILQDTPKDLAKRVHAASKQLLTRFETLLSNSSGHTTDITPSWQRYARLFETWKSKDQQLLLESTIAHYHGLLDLKTSIGHDPIHDTSPDRREALLMLDEQLRDTRAKIERLGGTVPQETRHQHKIPTPPESDRDEKEQEAEIHTVLSRLTMQQQQQLTNEQLAHNLIVDPDFRLTRPREESLERRVAAVATKAFFERLMHDMNKDDLLQVLSDLHKRLDQVVPLLEKSRVAQVMDLDLIKQQMDTDSFDLHAMLEFVLDKMAESCAPARDDAIHAIRCDARRTTEADRLCRIMDVLQDMALDLANIQLTALRPHLLPIAVQYGRAEFQRTHPSGPSGLVRTRAWLATVVPTGDAVNDTPNAAMKDDPRRARFNDAFASLITTWTDQDDTALAETLCLDAARIRQFQQSSLVITTVAALAMIAKSFGSSSSMQQQDGIARLLLLVRNDTTTVDHLCTEILRHCSNTTKEDPGIVRSMVDKTLNRQDGVFSLLQRRVASVIKDCLGHPGSMPAMKTLESYGLDCLADELKSLCERAEALADYNYRVHGPQYDEIIQSLQT